MTDLYQILDIARSADSSEIKSAYRRKAKEHHPDTGGDPEAFQQVAIAYTVLSDHERRKEYDLTGEIDKQGAINIMTEVVQAVAEMLEKFLDQSKGKISGVDVVAHIRKALSEGHRQILGELAGLDARVRDLEDMRKRIKRNDREQNIFINVIDDKLRHVLSARKQKHRHKIIAERAIEEMDHYSSPIDMARFMQGMIYPNQTTMTWTTGTNVSA